MSTNAATNTFRTTARVVGALYIAGMVIGIWGNVMLQSILTSPDGLAAVAAKSLLVGVAAVMWLLTAVGDIAHGVLMFPVLRPRSERAAVGYLAFRIVDAVFIALMIVFVLLQIPLANEYLKAAVANATVLQPLSSVFTQVNLYAYHIAMFSLGVASLILCYTLYRARLVPRFLAIWGLIGYAIILIGSAMEILGFPLQSMQTILGGLWELFFGVWLIVKGFNASAFATQPAKP